ARQRLLSRDPAAAARTERDPDPRGLGPRAGPGALCRAPARSPGLGDPARGRPPAPGAALEPRTTEAAAGRTQSGARSDAQARGPARRGQAGPSHPPAGREGILVTLVAIPQGPSILEGYQGVLGQRALDVLEGVARQLRRHRLVMVNSTAVGGGVAEILHRLVRLLNELGVHTTWEVMEGTPRFFAITKTIHNTLHGLPGVLDEEDRNYFRSWAREQSARLALDGDLIMIHDPQPIAMVEHRRRPGQQW